MAQSTDRSYVYSMDDPTLAKDFFISKSENLVEVSAILTHCRKYFTHINNSWASYDILKSLREKHSLREKVRKNSKNWTAIEHYKTFCTNLTKVLPLAKKRYFQDKIILNGNNHSKMWELIKHFFLRNTLTVYRKQTMLNQESFANELSIANALSN